MRILFATSIKTWGGGEEWMLSAVRELTRRGHTVGLAARPDSTILTRARSEGLPALPTAFRSDGDVASFLRILLACRRLRVEIVCLNMDRVLRVAGSAARLAGVPVVLPRRGSEFPLKPGPLYRFSYRRIATGMIVNSEATAAALCREISWTPAGRVHVLPNGVDLARFEAPVERNRIRETLGIPAEAPLMTIVGELTHRKDVATAIRALAELTEAAPDARLLLIGEGDTELELRQLATECRLADRVIFAGFRSDVPALLAASDLLLHPSRVEGFGYAVAEGMAAGLPVVATDASSIPEIVEDGSTGRLFPPGQSSALREAAEAYLLDPELRRRHGQAGRARVRRRFALQQRADELEGIFREELRRTNAKRTPS
ncbi:MAG: glycosyltransferase [Gemmatimonadota bacterium]|nr:glycosyltransferase [Gemmatimonadota bacterium]MDP7031825.1 glycosyltransferase [Gemmatimonadota bacterium]